MCNNFPNQRCTECDNDCHEMDYWEERLLKTNDKKMIEDELNSIDLKEKLEEF